METSSKKNLFKSYMDLLLLVAITAIFTVLAGFGLFQKLDFRLYDIMLGTKKEAKADKSILFVEVDDSAIDAIGAWPWSRDILGDALIRMKELGAAKAVFDIEYLSTSQLGVDPDAVQKVADAFTAGEADIAGTVTELSNAIAAGQISKSEVKAVSDEMIADYIDPALQNLYTSVTDHMYSDNDTYF